MTWRVVQVACETGISPDVLADLDPDTFSTMVAYLTWRGKQQG